MTTVGHHRTTSGILMPKCQPKTKNWWKVVSWWLVHWKAGPKLIPTRGNCGKAHSVWFFGSHSVCPSCEVYSGVEASRGWKKTGQNCDDALEVCNSWRKGGFPWNFDECSRSKATNLNTAWLVMFKKRKTPQWLCWVGAKGKLMAKIQFLFECWLPSWERKLPWWRKVAIVVRTLSEFLKRMTDKVLNPVLSSDYSFHIL